MVYRLSAEERLYKQLEGIVSSIIKALEGLEREFSEYIEVTNKRLQTLEDKMQKMESLADVSGKGLVKAIESSSEPDKVKGLAHLTQSQPKEESSPAQQPPVMQPPEIDKSMDAPSVQSEPPKETPADQFPPVPTPPSIRTKPSSTPSPPSTPVTTSTTSPDQPETPTPSKPEKKKGEDEDKEELLSALKIIDSL
jgi:hypothetical protein